MTTTELAHEVIARFSNHPKQPTRKEELEFDRFCKEAALVLAKARIEEEKKP